MNRPLRILQVTKSTAGVAEYVRWLANGLDATEFSQTVACLSEDGEKFATELSQIPGVHAFSLEMDRYKIDPLSDAKVAYQLSKFIRREKPDLIHAHASKPGFLARLAAAGSKIPVIYSPHCFSFHAGVSPLKTALLAFVERQMARYLTAHIMTVADGEQMLAMRYGVGQPEQFTTIYSGIGLDRFTVSIDLEAQRARMGVPLDVPLVATVGRMSQQKAPLDIVRMAWAVHKVMADVHFVWIGSGPLEKEARDLVLELGLENVFHFPGQCADAPVLLHAVDCFVLASLWEGLPIVILEALAAGAPVVATDIPGNDEIIVPGVNGWLTPPNRPEAMADKVLDLLQNTERAALFVSNGKQTIEGKFSRKRMLSDLAKLYRWVVSEKVRGEGLEFNAEFLD